MLGPSNLSTRRFGARIMILAIASKWRLLRACHQICINTTIAALLVKRGGYTEGSETGHLSWQCVAQAMRAVKWQRGHFLQCVEAFQ